MEAIEEDNVLVSFVFLSQSTDLNFCSNEPTTTDDPLPFFFSFLFSLVCPLLPPLTRIDIVTALLLHYHYYHHHGVIIVVIDHLYVDTSLRLPLTALRLVTSAFAARQSHPNYMFPHVFPFDDERPFDDGHGRNRFVRWSNGRYLE